MSKENNSKVPIRLVKNNWYSARIRNPELALAMVLIKVMSLPEINSERELEITRAVN